MSTKIIAFEGADFSGKSTLAEEMAKSYDFAMLVHFPLMNYDIASIFDSMKGTIYNEKFMNNLREDDIGTLTDTLLYNIMINNKNQIMFLDNLISIQDKGYTDFTCSAAAIEDFRFFDNRKEIKYESTSTMIQIWKMMLNRTMIHEKGVDKAIIFDRSIVSTRVYNYIIPNKVLDKYITKYTNDNTESSSKIAAKLKEIKSLIRTAQETAEVCYMDKLNKVTRSVYPKINPFIIICNNSDNVTEFYKQKRADKNDDYDKNTMIQEVAKKYYDDLYNINTKGKTSEEICNLITNSYEIKPIKSNMIFSRIADENVKPDYQIDYLLSVIRNYSSYPEFDNINYF